MQPMPLEDIRAQVLTVKPRSTYVCCVCHQRMANRALAAYRLCGHPACFLEAVRLEWL